MTDGRGEIYHPPKRANPDIEKKHAYDARWVVICQCIWNVSSRKAGGRYRDPIRQASDKQAQEPAYLRLLVRSGGQQKDKKKYARRDAYHEHVEERNGNPFPCTSCPPALPAAPLTCLTGLEGHQSLDVCVTTYVGRLVACLCRSTG